uniref:Uncharacterized protein n=1 Tax=Hyaloperonospora arabidopsidis (strain Emoy2) TaxID=559515 RepID=M4BCB8_HYAAE
MGTFALDVCCDWSTVKAKLRLRSSTGGGGAPEAMTSAKIGAAMQEDGDLLVTKDVENGMGNDR